MSSSITAYLLALVRTGSRLQWAYAVLAISALVDKHPSSFPERLLECRVISGLTALLSRGIMSQQIAACRVLEKLVVQPKCWQDVVTHGVTDQLASIVQKSATGSDLKLAALRALVKIPGGHHLIDLRVVIALARATDSPALVKDAAMCGLACLCGVHPLITVISVYSNVRASQAVLDAGGVQVLVDVAGALRLVAHTGRQRSAHLPA